MLDLKAKLAAAGLVSEADVQRAEAERRAQAERRSAKPGRGGKQAAAPKPATLPVATLRGRPKGEIYDAVRRFVERVRLDPVGGAPSETARAFHFPEPSGRIGRLVLEPELAQKLELGETALVAFMSNHGLAHAVVPADAGRAIVELMPKWLRVLVGDARAGVVDEPTPSGEPDATPPEPNAPYVRNRVVDPAELLPDARDGLTRIERIVLFTLHELQRERGDRNVPTAMLYGRVVERIDISVDELQRVLQRLIGVR